MTETIEVEFYIGVDGHGYVSVSTDHEDVVGELCSDEAIVIYCVKVDLPRPPREITLSVTQPIESPTLTQQSARLKLPE